MTEQVGERRADVQILRAVAVLAVMLAHFGGLIRGGFLGVDVFFVISGFVITLSLFRLAETTHSTGELLREFWRRRFWRLAPPLFVVLLATLITAALILPPEDFHDQVQMSLWSLFFAGNIGVEVIWKADYFDPGAEQNWLLHLWSLGVEEQFYLVFPFLFLLLFVRKGIRNSTGKSVGVIVAVLVTSFLLSLVNDVEALLGRSQPLSEMTGFASLLGYYSPATRAWQFLIGVLAALMIRQGIVFAKRSLSAVGAVVILASLVAVPESNLLPGPITLVPMVATFLLLISPVSPHLARHTSLSPLRWLGDRSYSAYLWHWPVWLTLESFFGSSWLSIVLGLVITAILADRSYVWIEQRLKVSGHVPSGASAESHSLRLKRHRVVFVAVLLPMTLLSGPGVWAAHESLESAGVLREAPPVPRIDEARDCVQVECAEKEIDVLLIGDSHAGALSTALIEQLEDKGLSTYGAIIARHWGCLHLPGEAIVSIHEECRELSERVRELVKNNPPSIAILYGYTAGRFTTINSGGDSPISLMNSATGDTITDEKTAIDSYDVALGASVDYLTNLGIEVVIVTGTPDFTLRPEEANGSTGAASQAELLLAPWVDFEFGQTITKEAYISRHGVFQSVEKALAAENPRVHYVETWGFLCEETSCSQASESGEYLYSDQDHVSPLGASLLAKGIVDEMALLGLVPSAP